MKSLILASVLSLTLVGAAGAAELSNPPEQLPQPVGAKRFYTQHELRMIYAYRLGDPTKVDFLESGGDSGGAGSAGTSGGDAGASGAGAGTGCK